MIETILYGPIPVRPLSVVGAAGLLFVAWISAEMSLERVDLRCRADTDRCDWTTGGPSLRRHTVFPRAALTGVRVVAETTSNKGAVTHYGVPYLEIASGAPLRSMRVTPEEAEAFAATVRAGIAGRQAFSAALRAPVWGVFIAPIIALIAAAVAHNGLRDMGSMALRVDRAAGQIRVARRILWIGLPWRTFALPRGADVIVEPKRTGSWLDSRAIAPERYGRLVLTAPGAERQPLTGFMRGHRVHLAAAAALRAALGHPPGSLEAELIGASTPVPHPMAPNLAGKLAVAWMGACIGSIVGMAVLWGGAAAVGLTTGTSSEEIWPIGGALLGALAGIGLALWWTRAQPPE